MHGKLPNPAVPEDVSKKVLILKLAGKSEDDVIKTLRQETVPPGHTPLSWIEGEVLLLIRRYAFNYWLIR